MTTGLDVPVAFFVFNRPSHTETVLKTIAAVRPKKLFIVADGPRAGHPTDAMRCDQVRAIVANVTWPCDVRTEFADSNMGCRRRTVTGIDWIFGHVDEVILVEDDNVCHETFFRFCEEMLSRYRDDRRIMSVCGCNVFPQRVTQSSYFFSTFGNPWGRAIWRRSWECFDEDMKAWPEVRDRGLLANVLPRRAHRRYWEAVMEHAYQGGFDTWGYRFILSCWLQNGLSVVPARNLVRNIGFSPDATHTKVDSGGAGRLPLQGLDFPLRHPTTIMPDRSFDDRVCDALLRESSILRRGKNKAKYLSSRLVELTLAHMNALPRRAA